MAADARDARRPYLLGTLCSITSRRAAALWEKALQLDPDSPSAAQPRARARAARHAGGLRTGHRLLSVRCRLPGHAGAPFRLDQLYEASGAPCGEAAGDDRGHRPAVVARDDATGELRRPADVAGQARRGVGAARQSRLQHLGGGARFSAATLDQRAAGARPPTPCGPQRPRGARLVQKALDFPESLRAERREARAAHGGGPLLDRRGPAGARSTRGRECIGQAAASAALPQSRRGATTRRWIVRCSSTIRRGAAAALARRRVPRRARRGPRSRHPPRSGTPREKSTSSRRSASSARTAGAWPTRTTSWALAASA